MDYPGQVNATPLKGGAGGGGGGGGIASVISSGQTISKQTREEADVA
jgi:hypothetical protein